jgi:hypothetical protein
MIGDECAIDVGAYKLLVASVSYWLESAKSVFFGSRMDGNSSPLWGKLLFGMPKSQRKNEEQTRSALGVEISCCLEQARQKRCMLPESLGWLHWI